MTVPLAGAAYVNFPQSGAAAASSLPTSGTAPMDQAAAAVQGFTTDLYRALAPAGGTNTNLVFSPYSIALALAMAREGANGTTATEMDRVLHAPKPGPSALDSGLAALNETLTANYLGPTDGDAKRPLISIADSLWTQRDLAVRSAFTDALTRYYGAEPHRVDFRAAADSARQEINQWISNKTYAKIPNLLPPGSLDAMTRLVLANAIYLKAQWGTPFDPKSTGSGSFTRADGKSVKVPLMNSRDLALGYASTADYVAVQLPYVGHRLAMTVILPSSTDLAGFETRLDAAKLAAILTAGRSARVQLTMPRWKFRVPTDLGAVLCRLGMSTAFSTAADFSGIAGARGELAISKVVHEAFVAVDEYGTEAAAATAVAIGVTSAPTETKKVVLDRPFMFVIHDIATAAPLFIGRVSDPSAS